MAQYARQLAVISTHPIQYQAPVWAQVQQTFGVPTRLIYGSDFSIVGYRDEEFGTRFRWDVDLIPDPTACTFLSRAADGAKDLASVRSRGIGEVLDRIAPRAVLLTGYGSLFHLDVFRAAWLRRIPMLFRAETADHTHQRKPISAVLRSQLLRFYYSHFRRLLPIGARSFEHYRSLGCPESKLIFSPYCVNTEVFQCGENARELLRPKMRAELGARDTDLVVLFSGKLSRRKGVYLLVSALKILTAELRSRLLLLFVGDGSAKPELEASCGDAPTIRTHFAGFMNQCELSTFYHAADILVLPSITGETWGLVVNEALHHGVPCVVSDAVGCAPDLIEPGITGHSCRSGNIEELAGAIEKTLGLSGRANCRAACREKVSRYSVTAAAAGIACAFDQVAHELR